MHRHAHSILPVVFVACAGTQSPPPAASSPAARIEVASTTAPATTSTPVNVEPTVLREEQKKRDAARVPLATAVTDAFPNSNGIFSTLVASWSPDGKRFVFGSQRDGTPQVYLGENAAPSATPKALTLGPERALWARFTRDGKSILFLRDSKGDENFHIFRVALDGTGLTDLTPGEGVSRSEPVLPRAVPGLMLYLGSGATDGSSTLFAQSITGGEPRAVFTNPRAGVVLDVTPDGSHALFLDAHSADDLVVVEVDVASGKGRRLYPAEGRKVSVLTVSYSPDGKVAYVTTDEGAESSILVAIDVKTGREVGRYANDSPAPMNAIVSPKGNRIAVHIDAGNHGEVRILDSKTLEVERAVQVPLGFIQLGSFRDDGKAFSLLISRPDLPPDVYEVDSAMGSVKPMRQDLRRGLESLPPIEASIAETKAFDGLIIPINQYLPRGTVASKKLPTLAIFHGGLAYNYAVRWSNFNRFFSALGYAVIEPNVRGSAGFGRAYELADNREKRADWLKDVEAVNAWAKSQPWCDPDRVVVFGADYGGYTSLMALTRQPTLWRAGVDLFGITDLKLFVRNTDPTVRSFFVAEFGDPDKEGALLEAWSPSRDMDKIVAPLFVYAGQNDARVPRSEPDAIVNALRQRKVPVEYMLAANEGHGIDRRENQIELMTRLGRFLEDSMAPAAK